MEHRTTTMVPRDARGRVQLAAALLLVLLAFAGSAAVRVHGALAEGHPEATVTTATSTTITPVPAPVAEPTRLTIGDLASGRVPQDVQDRFWQAQLDAIVAAPCPPPVAAGATTVTLFLGADEAWTARLADATAAKRATCAG